MLKPEDCNRDIKTYGDVIRHMTNDELAIFLEQMGGDIEMGIMAIMRAKMYPHRSGEDPVVETKGWQHMHSFMEHRISAEKENYADVWGVENWQDLMQWEWPGKKNFGMNIVY